MDESIIKKQLVVANTLLVISTVASVTCVALSRHILLRQEQKINQMYVLLTKVKRKQKEYCDKKLEEK